MRRLPSLGLLMIGFCLVAGAGCDKVRSLANRDKSPEADAAPPPAQAQPQASGAERLGDAEAVCQVESHKVWGKHANRRTGITATRFGERVALGVALGNQPHVLVVEPSGEAKLVRLSAPAGTPLAKDIPAAQGTRDLQRVTPVMIGDRLSGYADYRDKHKSERRRIACEPVESNAPLLVFDGKATFSEQPAPKTAKPPA